MSTTVLILSAGTGGGHHSVATALCDALAVAAPSAQAVVATPFGPVVDRGYTWMLNHAPRLWGACYAVSNTRPTGRAGARICGAAYRDSLRAILNDARPDLVISVHALCAQVAAQVLHRLAPDTPHHCVVTDLVDIHRTWSAPEVDVFYVATTRARQALLREGVLQERILVTGLPLRRQFWSGPAPLQRDSRAPLRVLLMDGGTPGPALERALAALQGAHRPLEVVVARGGHPHPESERAANESLGPVASRDLGPHEAIGAAMRAVDLLVTKAGSVSVAEALAMGRPLLIHRAVPGQERGNPSLLQAAGAGHYTPTAGALCAAVDALAADHTALNAMSARAATLGRPDAALRIGAAIRAALAGRSCRAG